MCYPVYWYSYNVGILCCEWQIVKKKYGEIKSCKYKQFVVVLADGLSEVGNSMPFFKDTGLLLCGGDSLFLSGWGGVKKKKTNWLSCSALYLPMKHRSLTSSHRTLLLLAVSCSYPDILPRLFISISSFLHTFLVYWDLPVSTCIYCY